MLKFIYVDSYKAQNLGDDLFLKILFERYSKASFLMYGSTTYKKMFKENKNVRIIRPLMFRIINFILKAFKIKTKYTPLNLLSSCCCATVQIGGSIFIEDKIEKPLLINNLFGYRPMFIIGCNFGPFKSEKFMLKCLDYFKDNIDDICFRDVNSYDIFKNLSNVRYAPDIVFTFKQNDIQTGNGLFVSLIDFSEREELREYNDFYRKYIKAIIARHINRGETIRIASFCKEEGDENAVQWMYDQFSSAEQKNIKLIYYNGNIGFVLNEMNKSKIVIASRFHSIILAFLLQKKVIPFSYSIKTENFFHDVGLSDRYISLKNINYLDMQDEPLPCQLSAEQLEILKKKAVEQFSMLDKYIKNNY